MSDKIKVIAICGSTRKTSSNLNLIKGIGRLATEVFELSIFEGLSDIPQFNPDLDLETAPMQVANFRGHLKAADAILICTPEYAMGVPGTLKNAIDWTVSSMEFSKKPVALITASLSGEKAHASLLGTLLIIESKMTADTQLLLPGIKSKIDEKGNITDQLTLDHVNRLIKSLTDLVLGDIDTLEAPFLVN
jgi:chromate reductase, NAD(P)H dehydrogenase (quinone)